MLYLQPIYLQGVSLSVECTSCNLLRMNFCSKSVGGDMDAGLTGPRFSCLEVLPEITTVFLLSSGQAVLV